MNAAMDGPAVVIGVGNLLLHDDGVGVRVMQALRSAAEHDPEAEALLLEAQLIKRFRLGLVGAAAVG